MAALEDLEARIAALQASQADYRAVLAAMNALGANQRDHAMGLAAVEARLAVVDAGLADLRQETRGSLRSIDEHLAEVKDLIVGRGNGA